MTVAGLRLSSRSPWRPAAVALLLLVVGLWRMSGDERRRLLAAVAAGLDRIAPWTAGLAAVVVAVASTVYGTHVAGGADSSGYLSQSRLWANGQLAAAAPVVSEAPWPARGVLVAPLGYRPTARPDELGPTYAPGLPWLMALGAVALGDAGRYVWTPVLAGALVWGTFRLATTAAPPSVALGAALLVAGSPPMLFQATQTMSDLPVAALWVWVLVWLHAPGWRATLGAGAARRDGAGGSTESLPGGGRGLDGGLHGRPGADAAPSRWCGDPGGAFGGVRRGHRRHQRAPVGLAAGLGLRPGQRHPRHRQRHPQPRGDVAMDARDARLLDGGRARRRGGAGGAARRPRLVAGGRSRRRRARQLSPVCAIRRVVVPALLSPRLAGRRRGVRDRRLAARVALVAGGRARRHRRRRAGHRPATAPAWRRRTASSTCGAANSVTETSGAGWTPTPEPPRRSWRSSTAAR